MGYEAAPFTVGEVTVEGAGGKSNCLGVFMKVLRFTCRPSKGGQE